MNKKPSRPQVNPNTLKRLLGYLSVYKTRVFCSYYLHFAQCDRQCHVFPVYSEIDRRLHFPASS